LSAETSPESPQQRDFVWGLDIINLQNLHWRAVDKPPLTGLKNLEPCHL